MAAVASELALHVVAPAWERRRGWPRRKRRRRRIAHCGDIICILSHPEAAIRMLALMIMPALVMAAVALAPLLMAQPTAQVLSGQRRGPGKQGRLRL